MVQHRPLMRSVLELPEKFVTFQHNRGENAVYRESFSRWKSDTDIGPTPSYLWGFGCFAAAELIQHQQEVV